MREAVIVNPRGIIAHGTAGRTERVRVKLADLQANERDSIPAGREEPLSIYQEARVVRLPRRLAYCWSANAIRPKARAFAFIEPRGTEGHGNF